MIKSIDKKSKWVYNTYRIKKRKSKENKKEVGKMQKKKTIRITKADAILLIIFKLLLGMGFYAGGVAIFIWAFLQNTIY